MKASAARRVAFVAFLSSQTACVTPYKTLVNICVTVYIVVVVVVTVARSLVVSVGVLRRGSA